MPLSENNPSPVRNKVGLVLGSGAARGLAHVGILKALHDHHIPIDIITGTSIGAFFGAIYASGMHPDEMLEKTLALNWFQILDLIDPIINKSGLIRGNRIEEFIRSLIGNIEFSDLKIPFSCQCTDINTGKLITIKNGNLAQAVRASLSVPGLMIPFNYNDKQLVDGGLVDPIPVKEAQILGADIVIAANVTTDVDQYTNHKSKKKSGFFSKLKPSNYIRIPSTYQIILQSIYIMESEIARHNLIANPPDILIKPKIDQFRLYEFYKTQEIVQTGIDATVIYLDQIKALIESNIR